MKKTFQTQGGFQTGMSSNREVQEFIFHPDEIKNLQVGECVLAIKNEGVAKRIEIPWGQRPPRASKFMPTERDAVQAEEGATARDEDRFSGLLRGGGGRSIQGPGVRKSGERNERLYRRRRNE